MNFLRRLFGSGTASSDVKLDRPFKIQLEGSKPVPVVYVDAKTHPLDVLNLLKLGGLPRSSVFITGGASNMSEEDVRLTRILFEKAIAPFAQQHQSVVIDGGTEAGVVGMMADARIKGNYTFPLIGIAPYRQIHYPGRPDTNKAEKTYPLCKGHTHFALVTGEDYGAESELIVNMAHVVAGGERDKAGRTGSAIGIVVNGGAITRQEAYMATTKYIDIPLIVMEGSGRFADELASAVRTGETSQALIRSIIDRGNVQLAGTAAGPASLREKLEIAYRTGLEN